MIPHELQNFLRCPVCFSTLRQEDQYHLCQNNNCQKRFPTVNGIPILINEDKSVFAIDDFTTNKETTFADKGRMYPIIRKFVPSISNNIRAKKNYKKLLNLLRQQFQNPRILIIGGSIIGEGMEELLNEPDFIFLESDVSFGPRTQAILDSHNIPFKEDTFDCIIFQAVLEHVVEPYQCTKEAHRVLKNNGLVYAETPFMQQVHMGRYDFHRFTHLGHRRLFRDFSEIESGAVCGPGMALAWAYSYFIFSFFDSKKIRKLLIPFTNLTSFFWKYFDYFLIDKPGTLDAASGFYFLGRKSELPISDNDLLKGYKGLL